MRSITAHLYRTGTTDLRVLAPALGGLFAAAILACAVPAWRAARSDPACALRAE